MTLSLEDRLAAAGEQLDALVDLEQPVLLGVAQRPSREPRTAAMLVSLSAVILVVVGLVWATRPDEPTQVPAAETSAPPPTASITTAPPATTPTTKPTQSSAPAMTIPPVVPTTIPFDERQPTAIGESVMKGATQQLMAGGFRVDAEESRQGQDFADRVEQLATGGELGRTVVIQTGTNGPVAADDYHRIAEALADADQVVFLTVHASRAWIPGNNALIWSLPSQYANVIVLDWDGLVSAGAVPGMAGDEIHLGTADAQQFYANYIFSAIGRNDLVRPVATSVSASDLVRVLPAISAADGATTTSDQPLLVGDGGAEVVDDVVGRCLRVPNDDGSVGSACNADPSAGSLTLSTSGPNGPTVWFFLVNSAVSVEGAGGCSVTQQTASNLTLVRCETTGDADIASVFFALPDGRRYFTTVPVGGGAGPVTP